MQSLDLRIPVPRRAQSFLPMISVVLTLLVSVFRVVFPLVGQAKEAIHALENEDPQVVQEQRAQRPM